MMFVVTASPCKFKGMNHGVSDLDFSIQSYHAAVPYKNLDSVQNALIQENIIDFEGPNPNQHLNSKNVESFNNTTPSGTLVQGHTENSPDDPLQKDDELAKRIEDAILISLL